MHHSSPHTKKYFAKLFLLCTVFHLCLGISGQSTGRVAPKITLTAKNVTITDVFKAIKNQTGKVVWFMNEDVNADKKVTVKFENASLDEVMKFLFGSSSEFTWSLDGEKIILRKKKEPVSVNVVSPSSFPSSIKADSLPSTITVTGKVTDEKGNPIIGATVVVAGTRIGTTTNADGAFVLREVRGKALLTMSSIGYLTKEVPVQGRASVGSINLKEYVGKLDETVVIAYSTTTKRLNAGNVTTVSGEDIAKQPVSNPLLTLQGRVPGLFITQNSGLPGSAVSVTIQGQNSIEKGNDPFYVIDGVPYPSQLLPNFGNVLGQSGNNSQLGNPLSFINPADIESISVLKDAAATAIYGSRAANGAILITTKKGKAGQTKIDINIQNGWGKVTRTLDLLNTRQYLEMRHEAFRNDGLTSGLGDYDINGTWDTTRNTNWQKTLIGAIAKYTNVNASVSGGSNSTQYLIGGTYHHETTVFPGNFADQRGSMHFSVNSMSSNQKFQIQLLGNYMIDDNRLPNKDLTGVAIYLAPDAPPPYNKDGTLNWAPNTSGSSTWYNPLAYLYGKYQNKTTNLVSNVILSYQILPGLDMKNSFGYTNLESNEINTTPLLLNAPENRPYYLRYANYGHNIINSWIIEPQVTYKHILGKGRLEILLGTTIQQNNSKGVQLTGSGYNSDLVLQDILAASNVSVGSTIASVYKYNAAFGRLNYSLQDKYIIDLTTRRDGSSRFGSANRFHNFGAVGIAWIFSEENVIKKKLSFLSFGKLRASYGTTGNDQIDNYRFLNLYNPISAGVGYQGITGLMPNGLTNPYLQWEETKKLQFGLELGLLKDWLFINVNYFRNRSSNQLLSYTLPLSTGFYSITKNFPATVQNAGWELSLNTTNIKIGDFSWSSNINITLPLNKLVAFPGLKTLSYADLLTIGQPLNTVKTFKFLDIDPATGIYRFIDSHGNSTSSPDNLTDKTVLIAPYPRYYGGIQNSFKYKGFEIDFLVQFVKQKAPNQFFGVLPGFKFINQPTSVLNRWQKPEDVAPLQRYSSDFSLVQSYVNAVSSDKAYSDASYLRLKNLSVSWQLPEMWRQRVHLQSVRLFMQGQNLLTVTNYPGLDPESHSFNSLPPLKVLTIGLQIGL
ncbi:TonB-linked outer membrane protein, SusC/RagA family [Chitinophaga sp. CF118]|uniref:SusC/RagA family TonB-linked outer membrane protein n=1 Tax=Chitinophaga sp. CF118 TaxID=1884367 RepID=UPI0008E127C7|nr:SusC/RagA family TonB-linked outer membrane protein [Chitinophaga sp. CF118]SFE98109.1 TonB-linked outer membrane protein, SusC/RagA family [Chitinophaga sp. CF118]